MPQDTHSRKLDQYIVRFPDGMRDRLKQAAAENKRSLNAEIVDRLQASFGYGEHFQEQVDYLEEGFRILHDERDAFLEFLRTGGQSRMPVEPLTDEVRNSPDPEWRQQAKAEGLSQTEAFARRFFPRKRKPD